MPPFARQPSSLVLLVLALAACTPELFAPSDGTYDIPRAVTTPVPVGGTLRFTAITSGFFHSCGLDVGGRAWCWGDDEYRQLGTSAPGQPCDGVSTCHARPVAVETALRFASIAAGTTHTCALTADGAAWCWGGGYGGAGILGDGQRRQSALPVAVAGGLRFRQLAVGVRATCGIALDDRAWCWGERGYVGDGRQVDALAPVEVAGEHRFASISAGSLHACGVTTAGEAWCWGGNPSGQLGDGRQVHQSVALATRPVRVLGTHRFRAIGAGGDHTCALTTADEAVCWGLNHVGQLGTGGASEPRTTPVAVSGGRRFAQLSAGTVHGCGVATDGVALCWGGNWFGGIGDGTSTAQNTGAERPTPTPVKTTQRFTAVAAGGSHSCGLATDGRLWCWGDRGRGQLAD